MSDSVWLAGAIVQKVERPVAGAILLSLRLPGRSAHVVAVAGRRAAIGEIDRPSGRVPADAQVMRLRRLLEGARVVAVRPRRDGMRVDFRRGDERPALLATSGGVLVLERVADDAEEPELAPIHEAEAATRDAAARDAFAAHVRGLRDVERRALASAIDAARRRMRRRIEAVEGDLARIGAADEWQRQATLLVSNQHLVGRGARSVTLEDWSTGEPIAVEIALDPSRSARENADALFHRAKRLKKGKAFAERRRADAERALAQLDVLRDEVDAIDTSAPTAERAIEVLGARARALGVSARPQGKPGARARREGEPRLPHHVFRVGERTLLVGRGAKDNDALTTKVARPHDVWLHAKGRTGAHVVIPLAKGEDVPSDLLVDAAHLAAHFSDARGEAVVDVQWAPRRHVRTPKGSAPGAVVVDREKVLVLRVEPERLERLLATKDE